VVVWTGEINIIMMASGTLAQLTPDGGVHFSFSGQGI
jgi:hypothetical protein